MRTAYVTFAGLLLLTVVYQFVTAGMIIFEGGDVGPHGAGSGIAHLWAAGMIVFAAIGKLGRSLIVSGVVLLVLVAAQFPIQDADGVAVLHPLVALLIAFGAYHALMAARAGARGGRAPAPQNPVHPTV